MRAKKNDTPPARARPKDLDKAFDILEDLWGNEKNEPLLEHNEPLDGLVLTLLSQNTNDRNRDRGFAALKSVFPSWEAVASAPSESIAEAIRPAGLAKTKSERLLQILETIKASFGEYSLEKLKIMEDDAIRKYLSSLPGIGAKTVACVMLFDLGRAAFPVDTHIARFCRRMGWVEETLAPEEIQQVLEEWVPPSRYLGGHVNIIEHGRGLCRARNPECPGCPLAPYCFFAGHKNGAS
jgi:endonuclease-3